MIKWMKRLNQALPMLVLGILAYGLLVELIGVWFVSDKIRYTTGLLIGIACAVGMAIHISMIIEESVRIGQGHEKLLSFKSVMRYLVLCAIMITMTYFKLGNMFTALIGVLGLKVSAYAQPLLIKAFHINKVDKDIEREVLS
ncbi:hypothetical protein [Pseudobutyrivibrio xylanivorans]|uniref:ATP synthase subunit I n=1 Tax=Pseudobutyrivibrio xylanivorans TaxID=185007 RepID=A0A5P6VP18_PSEXY|nr:hypothetical protein [Pseudobutyrivibrio xylanivorans]QFJ54098.1 hypothetical protein FXF36_04035 [Pseudobutyrivibrio xylanivorans]